MDRRYVSIEESKESDDGYVDDLRVIIRDGIDGYVDDVILISRLNALSLRDEINELLEERGE